MKHICERCGKEHDGAFGSGRFCSNKCAHSYSTYNEKDKKSLKEARCISCGKTIYINKRASTKNCKCDECKNTNRCQICGKINCEDKFCKKHNIQQFKGLIKYFGYDEKLLGTDEVEEEFERIRNLLYKLYWEEHKSSIEICKMFNHHNPSNLLKIFTYLDIPLKTVRESIKESYEEGRSELPINVASSYKCGYHKTWDNKEVYLRSSYEYDYAKKLDDERTNYEVESLRIRYYDSQMKEYRCAIPDFYLPDSNMIVEIKSRYTLDIQNMKDKMKEYKKLGYDFMLICDHEEMMI